MNHLREIIHIDDDIDDRSLLEELCPDGYILKSFESGTAFFRYLLHTTPPPSPCLIIVDLNMPVMDGWEVIEMLRQNKHFAATPIVVFTTAAPIMFQDRVSGLQVTVIRKPMSYSGAAQTWNEMIAICEGSHSAPK